MAREYRLRQALRDTHGYDTVLVDCPPSLGLLTVNALAAGDAVLIPVQCEYYALEGLAQLLSTIEAVRERLNDHLVLLAIVLTMEDRRNRLSLQVIDEVQRHFPDLVARSRIPRTVRLSEAPGFGVPITVYDPRSKGAQSYRDLAREVALRPPPDAPMPAYDEMPTISVTGLADGAPAMAPSDDEDEDIEEGATAVSEPSGEAQHGSEAAPDERPSPSEETAEVGVDHLEALERCERIGDAAEVALAHGDEIQDIAVLGDLLEQAAGIGERAREIALLHKGPDAAHLGLDARASAYGLGGCHQPIIARTGGGRRRSGQHR